MLHVKGTVAHASSGPTALAAANGRRRLLADCHAIEFGHREGEALHELTPLAFEAACSAEVQGSSSTRPLARARCVSGVREDCDALEQVASALALDVELLLVWASSITFVGGRGEEGCTLTQQDLIASAAAQILHLLVRDLEDNRAGSLTSVVDAASLELWGLSCTATAPFYSASCFLQIGADLCSVEFWALAALPLLRIRPLVSCWCSAVCQLSTTAKVLRNCGVKLVELNECSVPVTDSAWLF